MRRMKLPACLRFLSFSIFVLASIALTQSVHAQTAPSAGTTVVVKLTDAVDSANDGAGKQYRARVIRAAEAGNGVRISAGSVAVVTLVQNNGGSGWTTQLTSITIDGQPVAVTSGSVSLTNTAQNAASSALNSALGGFGRRVRAPATTTAIAVGQRVVLPPGTTLTFTLGEPPAATTPASPAAAAQPVTPSAQPASDPAASSTATSGASAGGSLTGMQICFSNLPVNPSDPNHKTEYLTAAFDVPINAQGALPALEPAYSAYLKATYHFSPPGVTCHPLWTIADARAAQKDIAGGHGGTAKLKRINTGWRYGQSPLAQGQSGFDPSVQGPGGLDLSQHRLTTYYCSLTAPGGSTMSVDMSKQNWNANMTTYVSPVFQADWDSAAVDRAYNIYIRDHFVHDLSLSDRSTRCVAQSPAMETMMHQTAMISNKRIGHAVSVDFTYTPAQVAAARASESAAAAHAAAQQASAPAYSTYVACSTSGGAGIDTYLTAVFPTSRPLRHMPNGGTFVDQSILDHFYAYLKQKGYNFKPGSNYACAVGRTEAEAEAAKHKRYYEGGGCSSCGKTVETGWKDTP